MARRQSSHRGGVSRPRVSVARTFDPVLTGSPVGSVSTRSSRRSVASNGTPKNRRTRRRTRVTEVEPSVAGVNDNWTPPPKREVKVARDTLLSFYETMDAQRKVAEEDDEFSALRGLVPKGGDRGRFLKTLGYSADPPEFNAGHPFSHHAGDTRLDAQVNRTDPWVAASKGHLREVEIYAKNTAGSADANMKCHLHPHETPLHQAAAFGHADVVRCAVIGKSVVTQPYVLPVCASCWACHCNCLVVLQVQFLLASGANPSAKDSNLMSTCRCVFSIMPLPVTLCDLSMGATLTWLSCTQHRCTTLPPVARSMLCKC